MHCMRVVRGLVGIIATATWATVLVVSGVAHAQPTPPKASQIEWQAPPGCPTPAAMRDLIAEVAGESATAKARVRARARQLSGDSWIVELDAGDGPRALRGRTCVDVARAAALVIGMAVRRRAEAPARPSQVTDGELPRWRRAGSAAPPQNAEVRIARAAPERRVRGPELAVRAVLGAATGVLPGTAGMARAGVETRWTRVALRLEATAATMSSGARLLSGDEVAVRETLVAAVGSGCWVAGPLSWCAGLEVGQVRASAVAEIDQESGSSMWTAASAGPSLVAPLADSVALVVLAEAAVPLVFPRFFINGQSVSEPDPVSFRTGLGLHVQIP